MKHIYLLCLLMGSLLGYSHAQIIYVDQDATGQNNGASWTNAYTDLNEALDVAQYGDSVWVAEGTYFPTDDDNRHRHFNLRNGVKLIGGFTGTETSASQRDWETYLTILDGDIGTPGDESDNSYTVMYVEVVDSTTWLDGFVIQHGYADGADSAATTDGGGLFFLANDEHESSPNFQNLVVRNNHAIIWGGGGSIGWSGSVSILLFSPLFKNCQIINNTADSDGGGLFLVAAPFERPFRMESCAFMENEITGQPFSGEAGGLYIGYSSFSLTDTGYFEIVNCHFEKNDAGEATSGGGGIRFKDSGEGLHLQVKNCTFKENVADEGPGSAFAYRKSGGATQLFKDEIWVLDCEFFGNHGDGATLGLGGYINQNFFVSGCYFEKNTGGFGAAIGAVGNTLITNSTFIENGGGSNSVLFLGSSVTPNDSMIVDHCTFIHNYHSEGMILFAQGSPNIPFGSMEVRNCVFRGNEQFGWFANLIGVLPQGGTPFVDNCIIDFPVCVYPNEEELTCGPNLIFADAVFIDSAGGDFRLHPCSPGIDMGVQGYWNSQLPTTDFLGGPRVVGAAADFGAFETPLPQLTLSSIAPPICPDDSTGIAELGVEYGCPPYTLEWPGGSVSDSLLMPDLPGGTYEVILTDAAGRTDTTELTVDLPPGPDPISVSATITDFDLSAPSNGSIQITGISGGTPPYTGQWYNGFPGDLLDGLLPGTYNYTVTDGQGCTAQFTFEVGVINGVREAGVVRPLQVFPNPFAHTLEVRLPAQADRYSVFDMQGRLMEVGDVQPGQERLQLGAAWSPGLYVVQVVSGTGEIWRGRVVKGE